MSFWATKIRVQDFYTVNNYLGSNISISIINSILQIYLVTFNLIVGVAIFIRLCRCSMCNFSVFSFHDELIIQFVYHFGYFDD